MVDSYYPQSNANTVCADCIMNYIKSQGHEIDFFAIKEKITDETYLKHNGSNVIKVNIFHNEIASKLDKKVSHWTELSGFNKLFVRGFAKIKKQFATKTNSVGLDLISAKKVLKTISKVNKHYDVIISFCMPFAFQTLAKKLMKYKLADRWYCVFLDPFVNNKCLDGSKVSKREKIAEKILSKADKLFVQEGIIQENLRQGFSPDYHNKVVEIALPNLIKRELKNNIEKTNKGVLLTYAGHLYADIRRPDEMLDIISKFDKKYTLQILGDGCEDIIDKKRSLFVNSKLVTKGKVSFDECLNELSKSNILVNIANTITNQMPSKVFEYISFGKPVINFYFSEDDLGLKYFKKYPLCFNLNVNNYDINDVEKLKEFCEKNAHKNISFEEATKSLQEYKSENICKKIYEGILN